MLRLFVKDNSSGRVHEYGTNRHDALILQDDGSLHYENMQCCAGTMFPEDGYSFCNEDGTIPKWDKEYGVEPYIDIGGEYYSKPTTNADRFRAMSDEEQQKCVRRFWEIEDFADWLLEPISQRKENDYGNLQK